jgi:hypothetical protein
MLDDQIKNAEPAPSSSSSNITSGVKETVARMMRTTALAPLNPSSVTAIPIAQQRILDALPGWERKVGNGNGNGSSNDNGQSLNMDVFGDIVDSQFQAGVSSSFMDQPLAYSLGMDHLDDIDPGSAAAVGDAAAAIATATVGVSRTTPSTTSPSNSAMHPLAHDDVLGATSPERIRYTVAPSVYDSHTPARLSPLRR